MNPSSERTPSRRNRPGYNLASLLRIAVTLFNERGYDGTSMDELSCRLGITKSAIYYHVSSKEDLLGLAVDRALDALFAVLTDASTADGRAIDQLEHLLRGAIAVLIDQLPFVTLLLRVRGNTAVERNALARRRAFDHRVTDLVRRAGFEGDVRPDVDPAVASRLLFGMVNSLIEWSRPCQDPNSHSAIADAICTIAFDGIRARLNNSQM